MPPLSIPPSKHNNSSEFPVSVKFTTGLAKLQDSDSSCGERGIGIRYMHPTDDLSSTDDSHAMKDIPWGSATQMYDF